MLDKNDIREHLLVKIDFYISFNWKQFWVWHDVLVFEKLELKLKLKPVLLNFDVLLLLVSDPFGLLHF